MPRKNPTSVVLNESVQQVKDELSPIYGLKNILSAGLLIFSRLSAEEQKQFIAEVNGFPLYTTKTDERGQLKNLLNTIATTHYKILSKEESQLLRELRKTLGPEPEKQKRRAKGG